jgi:hypothetical protein
MHYDSPTPTQLASYRRAYLDAITRASGGKLTHITRNSHIWTTLHIAICSEISAPENVYHLSKFAFGSGVLGYEVEQGINGGTWFTLRNAPEAIAEIAGQIYHPISVVYGTNEKGDSDGTDEGSAKQSELLQLRAYG